MIVVATHVKRGNTFSCNTRSSLLVHQLQQHGQVAIARSSNTQGVALVIVATPTTVAKTFVATPRRCKFKMHLATRPKKNAVQSFTHASACNASQQKKVLLFTLLQLF